jgi:photosystem II stability/assembly factor-like uncharacterized protein
MRKAICGSPTDAGLFHSTDGGAHFQKLESVASAKHLGFGKSAAGRDNPALYLAGTVGSVTAIYRSDDGGQSWLRLTDDQHQFGWLPDAIAGDARVYGRVYLGTNGRGVIYGEPDKGWRIVLTLEDLCGGNTDDLPGRRATPSSEMESRLLLSTAAYTWQNVNIGAGGFVDGIFYDPHNQNTIYARTDIGGLYKTTNDGTTWTQLLDFVGNNTSGFGQRHAVAIDRRVELRHRSRELQQYLCGCRRIFRNRRRGVLFHKRRADLGPN